ncbi:MAG: hypothetical protein V7K67_08995 [Nostoc sp.]
MRNETQHEQGMRIICGWHRRRVFAIRAISFCHEQIFREKESNLSQSQAIPKNVCLIGDEHV